MSKTLVYVVAIPLGDADDPRTIAEALTTRIEGDGTYADIPNYRLSKASYEVSPLGAMAALLDVTSKARNPA